MDGDEGRVVEERPIMGVGLKRLKGPLNLKTK
jgi:hypothetical protein